MKSSHLILSTVLLSTLLFSCSSNEKPEGEGEGNDTGSVIDTSSTSAGKGDSSTDLQRWFGDRYGPEAGSVVYDVTIGETTTERTSYFAEHGFREAHYLNLSEGKSAPQHITVIDSGKIVARGPGDPRPLTATWRPDPNQSLPNFRHLTDDMRQLFQLEELSSKEFLGKECRGYRLKIGKSISDVWVWEGIMLYSEIKGEPGEDIPPMIVRATVLSTTAPAEEVFHLQ
ncbi:MAG: hypothetical protein KDD67_08580 [Ignavibacteriae bacterium]|nr:hypothetical protein [Ignavibacteriota bacterium]MCB9216723.1 hypothetical protein [Ignavibacteria bacterium]